MTSRSRAQALGDSHNFGRRVERRTNASGARVVFKPRTLLWEWLLLDRRSPLRIALEAAGERAGLGEGAFAFLPSLAFSGLDRTGGEVSEIALAPLALQGPEERRAFARIVGRALALFAWLGVSDLHWENLALGREADGRIVFGPLDVEIILADMASPTETQLVPGAADDGAAMLQHACGVRRALAHLGKPLDPGDAVAIASAYARTLRALGREADAIADVFRRLEGIGDAPIRVLLRGTDAYAEARAASSASGSIARDAVWPPLLDAEVEQLARGDVPYFFRLLGAPAIRSFTDARLEGVGRLPLTGDVPRLEPLLSIARGLRSTSRKRLAEEGLFAVLGAFDHPSFKGTHADDPSLGGELSVTFHKRTIVLSTGRGRAAVELETRRDLRAFVHSVYQPCACGEVFEVLAPQVTRCDRG